MSTKFELPSATQNVALPLSQASGLCPALEVSSSGEYLISKDLPSINLSVAIRTFDPAGDIPILYKWMSLQYEGPLKGKPTPPAALRESYACMIESDIAQPFIGSVNHVPVCQIDICKANQDIISLSYDSRVGDYRIQIVLAPLAIQDNMVVLLKTALEYFFSFRELGRLVIDIEDRNEWLHTLFTRIGFRISKKIQEPYKTSNLLVCTKDSFRRAAKGPLLAKNP